MDDSTSISSIDFLSNSYHGKNFLKRMNCYDRHAELFRKDLISAMKMPDSETLQPDDYFEIIDSWKLEWERGVQVPVNVNAFVPVVKIVPSPQDFNDREMFIMPKKMLYSGSILDDSFKPFLHELYDLQKQVALTCRYDLDELDSTWLKIFNRSQERMGEPSLSESDMERIMEELEVQCHSKMNEAVKTIEGLGIEYDENVVCDICRSPEGEESNEMVFCDNCDICVHQACYGIQNIPEGSWLCRTCALGIKPKCVLCPMVGGAMKSTKNGDKWAHISCALWVPEVSIGCPERMEPITNISQIPASRWALVCTLCRERSGACIQCSVRSCKTSFHVTCAFKYGLDLSTVIDDETEDVQMKAYCPKHSGVEEVPTEKGETEEAELDGWEVIEPVEKVKEGSDRKLKRNKDGLTEEQRTEIRSQKMKRLTEDFYTFVDTEEVSVSLTIPLDVVNAIHSYWTLKRKSQFDAALMTIKVEEDGNSTPCQGEEKLVERLKMFIQLRQDLERVRNLCYMVNKREKMKRHERRMKEEIFHRQVSLYSRYLAEQEADDSTEDVCGVANGVKNFSRPLPPRKFQLSDSDDDDDDFSRNFHRPVASNNLSKYLRTIDSDDDNDEFRSLDDDDYDYRGIVGGGGGHDDDSATVKKDVTKICDEEKNFLLTAHKSTGTIYDMPSYVLSCSFKDCRLLKSDKNFIRSAVAAAVASRPMEEEDDDDDEIFPKSFKYDMKIDEDSLDNFCISTLVGSRGRGRPRKNKRGRPPRTSVESNKVTQIASLEEDDSDYYRRLSDEDFDEEKKMSTNETTPPPPAPPPPPPPTLPPPEKKKRGRKRKSELMSSAATADKSKQTKKKPTESSTEPRKKRKYTRRKGVKVEEINSSKDKLEKEEQDVDEDPKKDDQLKIISSPESYLEISGLSLTPVVNESVDVSLYSDVEQSTTKQPVHKNSVDDDDDDDDEIIVKECNARFIMSDGEEDDEVDPEVRARREKAAELLKDMEVSDSSTEEEEEEEVSLKTVDLKSPADDITEADDIIVYDIESQDALEEPGSKNDDVQTPAMPMDVVQDTITLATTTIQSKLLGTSSPLFSSSDDDDDDDDVSIGNDEKNNSKVTGVMNKELLNINSRHKLLHKLPIKEFIVSNQIKNMVQTFFSSIGSTGMGSNPRLAFNGFKLPQGRIEC